MYALLEQRRRRRRLRSVRVSRPATVTLEYTMTTWEKPVLHSLSTGAHDADNVFAGGGGDFAVFSSVSP